MLLRKKIRIDFDPIKWIPRKVPLNWKIETLFLTFSRNILEKEKNKYEISRVVRYF